MGSMRTFLDANVLISAARGKDDIAQQAFAILGEESRVFVTTEFVRLEVLPKSVYNGQRKEAEFYNEFFKAAAQIVRVSDELVNSAYDEATKAGLSAVDALHVAAAKHGSVDEFVTGEKPRRDLFRVAGLKITSLRA